ncbi:hypothetical protein P154DRAFT_606808 [Amniculicola lignicola CBS 123094]|uniref:Uncharacterized protein n=1 Tax=Amniculicola lignicola CBS 123094 TaxID=1392246 RepID=A0A6A5W7X2_9PLEO|nr:hypothetical protein P154DRAFT_606808 [Amniculicola lignicola CBS 123094]
MTNSLIFSPPLEDLETQQAPLTLSLYVKGPTSPVPAEAYNKDLPIGTGRPTSRHLLAATPLSASPQLARQFLAVALLDDWNMINRIYAEYNFLSSVYSAPNDELASLQRGMRTMLQVDDAELLSRYYQMREVGIGERDELGCRVEMFMLEADGEERGQWMESVDVGIGMGEEKRREWARNYADAGRFLRRAMLGY